MNCEIRFVIYVLTCTSLAGCSPEHSGKENSHTRDEINNYKISRVSGDALGTVTLLEALREGQVDSVIEVLESNLNSYQAILTITNRWTNATHSEFVQPAIEEIKRYREKYPESLKN
jgi:iron-sulfur cluster repair protein YtfE (RIC family)